MKNKHLTASDRQTIRELLHGGKNYVQIADILKKSPTTISREIEKHKVKVTRPGAENDCINRKFCNKEPLFRL
jgi:IS30 family transposase